jgi:hypothetical protein
MSISTQEKELGKRLSTQIPNIAPINVGTATAQPINPDIANPYQMFFGAPRRAFSLREACAPTCWLKVDSLPAGALCSLSTLKSPFSVQVGATGGRTALSPDFSKMDRKSKRKKPTRRNTFWVFRRVGLLFNEPSSPAELLFV